MPHDARCMGRELDEGICDRSDRSDDCNHRSFMVPCTTLPCHLELSEYPLYRVGNCYSAVRGFMAVMVIEDLVGLQDLPTGIEVHHVPRNALQHLHRKRVIIPIGYKTQQRQLESCLYCLFVDHTNLRCHCGRG